VLRRPPPLLAAALRALLVVAGSAAATVATACNGRGHHRSAPALPSWSSHAPQIAAAQAGRGGIKLLEPCGSAARRAAAPARHGITCRIAGLRLLLSIDLQLDGAMSSPGPAAKLALKWQTGLMGGDTGHDWAAQSQRSASAAQPAAAASAAAVATGT
jgi:hypothetical protein